MDQSDRANPRRRMLVSGLAVAAIGVPALRAAEARVVAMTLPLKTVQGAALAEGVELGLLEAAHGGLPIKMIALDDAGDPVRAVANVAQLIKSRSPVCFAACPSLVCAQAIAPLLAEARLPMVGLATGAEALRAPEHPYFFHSRASAQEEAGAIVSQLDSIGLSRFAVLHGTDSFGQEGVTGVKIELARLALGLSGAAAINLQQPDVAAAVSSLRMSGADAIVAVAPARYVADAIKGLAAAGVRPRVVAVSEVGTESLAQALGADARGVGFSQVFPHPDRQSTPLVREFHAAARQAGSKRAYTYDFLEGYVNGRIVAEAARRQARGSFITALENLNANFGGFRIRYADGKRRGSQFVEMSVIDAGGQVRV